MIIRLGPGWPGGATDVGAQRWAGNRRDSTRGFWRFCRVVPAASFSSRDRLVGARVMRPVPVPGARQGTPRPGREHHPTPRRAERGPTRPCPPRMVGRFGDPYLLLSGNDDGIHTRPRIKWRIGGVLLSVKRSDFSFSVGPLSPLFMRALTGAQAVEQEGRRGKKEKRALA